MHAPFCTHEGVVIHRKRSRSTSPKRSTTTHSGLWGPDPSSSCCCLPPCQHGLHAVHVLSAHSPLPPLPALPTCSPISGERFNVDYHFTFLCSECMLGCSEWRIMHVVLHASGVRLDAPSTSSHSLHVLHEDARSAPDTSSIGCSWICW